jgi:hypothetical protein
MRKYLFTISARIDGQTVLNFYNFESKLFYTENDLINSFKEFYSNATEVGIRSFREFEIQPLATEAA